MPNLVLAGVATLAVGSWVVAAAISFAPVSDAKGAAAAKPVPAPDSALLAAYTACSTEAETRLLGRDEAVRCSEIYLLLKLSFLPEIDVEDFRKLPPAERWQVQQRGYAALAAWRQSPRTMAAVTP